MSLKGKLKLAKAVIYKNRSNIEFIAGLLLEIGGTAYIVSKAGKASEIADVIHWRLEDIKEIDEEGSWEPGERNEVVRKLVVFAIKEYTKCYGIGFAMEIAGWILSGVSHATDRSEIATISAAMATLSATFAQYRDRVVADQGEEKDQEYMFGPQTVSVEVDKDGNVIQKTEAIDDLNKNIGLPPHCCMFDEANPNWEKEAAQNRDFLENHLRWLNQRLEAEGFLFENDIRRDLDLPLVKCGWTSGIIAFDGSDSRRYLDFGLEAKNPAAQRFRDGLEPSIMLQFNMDDNIIDQLNFRLV